MSGGGKRIVDGQDNVAKPTPGFYPEAAVKAADAINALHAVARRVVGGIHAQMMEHAWTIRQALPEKNAFEQFVQSYTALEPDMAEEMALVWDGARRNRELRELATRDPATTMRGVNRLLESGAVREEAVAHADPEVTRILAQPPAKQAKSIEALVARAMPLELDGGGALPAPSPARPAHELARLRAVLRELRTLDLAAMSAARGKLKDDLLLALDEGLGLIAAASDAVHGGEGAGGAD